MTSLRQGFLFVVCIGLALLLVPAEAQAQQQPTDARTLTNPTVKKYGRSGYPTLTVYVWGNADTGVWNVEKGTDLLEFVSVVSRVRMAENDPDSRRIETLSIYRNQNPEGDNDPFFESRIKDLFANPDTYPDLQEGDILLLETETRNRFTWRDIARVTGTVAALVNTYLLLDQLNDN